MAAANYDIIIDQGADFGVQLTLSENNERKDISGYSARAQLRQKKTSATTAADFICTIIDAEQGVLNIALTNEVTKDLTSGIYYYDLELYSPDDASVTRLLQGKATVTQEVTR